MKNVEKKSNKTGVVTRTRESIFQALGAIRAFELSKTFNRTMSIIQFAKIRQLYREKNPEVLKIAPDFKSICLLTGTKYDSIKEHLRNYDYFGLNFIEKAELAGFSIRMLRGIKMIPDKSVRNKAIEAVNTWDPDNESSGELKDIIQDLIKENTTLRDITNEASMKEKAEIIKERDILEVDRDVTRGHLNESQEKAAHWKEKFEQLYTSQKPEEQAKALRMLSAKVEALIEIAKNTKDFDDPIYRPVKDQLLVLFNEMTEWLNG